MWPSKFPWRATQIQTRTIYLYYTLSHIYYNFHPKTLSEICITRICISSWINSVESKFIHQCVGRPHACETVSLCSFTVEVAKTGMKSANKWWNNSHISSIEKKWYSIGISRCKFDNPTFVLILGSDSFGFVRIVRYGSGMNFNTVLWFKLGIWEMRILYYFWV